VRAEPLLPLAQQLFHPSACARQVFRMSLPLPLLWSAVIRALDLYLAVMYLVHCLHVAHSGAARLQTTIEA
jgi:hypothetical protein